MESTTKFYCCFVMVCLKFASSVPVSELCSLHHRPETSKSWHQDSRALLFHKLFQGTHWQSFGCSMISVISKSSKIMHNFRRKSQQKLEDPYNSDLIIIPEQTTLQKFTANIKEPNGWLNQSRSDMTILLRGWHPSDDAMALLELNWSFHLDKNVSIKIHFSKLSMPSSSTAKCSLSGMTVGKRNDDNYLFCGVFSSLSIFPRFNPIQATIYFYMSLDFDIASFLTIVDHSAFSFVPKSKLKLVRSSMSIVCKTCSMNSQYLVQVHKLMSVLIDVGKSSFVNRSDIFVLDGPWSMAAVVSLTRKKFLCSTFQCLVVFNTTEFCPSPWGQLLKYSAHSNNLHMEDINSKTNESLEMILPFESCHQFCGVKIQATAGKNIQLDLLKFIFSAQDQVTCTHGGFVIYEASIEKYLLCESSFSNISSKTRIYSETSEVVVVVFWYKQYSQISVKLQAQTTSCESVFVDPCVLRYHEKKHLMAKRSSFVEFPSLSSTAPSFSYQVNQKLSCFVLQIKRQQIDKYCDISLLHEVSDTKSINVVEYNLTMFLAYSFIMGEEVTLEGYFQSVQHWQWIGALDTNFNLSNGLFYFKWDNFAEAQLTGLQAESFGLGSLKELLWLTVTTDPGWSNSWIDVYIQFKPEDKDPTLVDEFFKLTELTGCADPAALRHTYAHTSRDLALTDTFLFETNTPGGATDKAEHHTIWIYMLKDDSNWELWFGCSVYSGSFDDGYVVSLPGTTLVSTMTCSVHSDMTMYILYSKHKDSSDSKMLKNEDCQHLNYVEMKFPQCFQYQTQEFYRYTAYFIKRQTELSWLEAHRLCTHEVGGHLPVFFSTEKMEEFLTLIKRSTELPYFEAVFIGLSVRSERKVSDPHIGGARSTCLLLEFPCFFRICCGRKVPLWLFTTLSASSAWRVCSHFIQKGKSCLRTGV